MMLRVGHRIYQNFLLPSRLKAYHVLLKSISDQGYTFLTIADLAACVRAGNMPARTCIIRMDVDSDLPTARDMFGIAQSLGVRATYYFRLSRLDPGLMRQIAASGSEVGYHYEELATIAKDRKLRNKREVDEQLPDIRAAFARNIAIFAKSAGHWPLTIASHGDWINRKLRLPNQYAIDEALRKQFRIVAEVYDAWLNAPVTARFSDIDVPKWWEPRPPTEAISAGVPCLYFLVHPRQWQANIAENIRMDAGRLAEGLRYNLGCTLAARRRKASMPPLDHTVSDTRPR
jgi:hypothetical protein